MPSLLPFVTGSGGGRKKNSRRGAPVAGEDIYIIVITEISESIRRRAFVELVRGALFPRGVFRIAVLVGSIVPVYKVR